ncbi:MAG: hypothetical protein EBV03_06120 [Proteobacteria bacterium]|nr:hypothetical protein [Pseudomonadota bacterium]
MHEKLVAIHNAHAQLLSPKIPRHKKPVKAPDDVFADEQDQRIHAALETAFADMRPDSSARGSFANAIANLQIAARSHLIGDLGDGLTARVLHCPKNPAAQAAEAFPLAVTTQAPPEADATHTAKAKKRNKNDQLEPPEPDIRTVLCEAENKLRGAGEMQEADYLRQIIGKIDLFVAQAPALAPQDDESPAKESTGKQSRPVKKRGTHTQEAAFTPPAGASGAGVA